MNLIKTTKTRRLPGRPTGRGWAVAAFGVTAALTLAGCSTSATQSEPGPANTPAVATPVTDPAPEPTADVSELGPSPADIAAVDTVEVTGALGAEPTITFQMPLDVSFPTYRLYSDGDGQELVEGQLVVVDAASFRGDTGELLFSTWTDGSSEVFVFGGPNLAVLSELLRDGHVGARAIIANPTTFQGEDFTAVNVFEVVTVIPPFAVGTPVEPAAGLPVVTLDDDGVPEVFIPEGYQPPDELVAQVLIKGDGPVVQPGADLLVHYRGLLLDGEEFDSSWGRNQPAGLSLNMVIPGWQQGLAGQTVGSQVLLVIPPELGYGPEGMGSIPGGATLVFVVDILWAN